MTVRTPENSPNVAASPERRIHARLNVRFDPQSVVYAELGDGKFGIVTNISEGGLAMQTVNPIVRDEIPNLRFRLSPTGNLIRPTARVAWTTVSKKGAGVQFVSISTAESIELRNWIRSRVQPDSRKQDGGAVVRKDGTKIEVAAAKPDSDESLTDRFDSLQQVLAERTTNHMVRRKLLSWTIAVILASVLVASLLVVKYWVSGTTFAQFRTVSNWSSTVIRSMVERTTDWTRSAIAQGRNRQLVTSGATRNLTSGSSEHRSKPMPTDSPSSETTLPSEPLDVKPNSVLNPSGGCRDLSGQEFPLGGHGQSDETKMQETTDPTDGEPILTIGPTYPIADAQSCLDGTVRLHATIDSNGVVRSLNPVSGPPTLFNAAIAAARYWRFEPTMREGQPVEAERDIQVVFKNMLADTR